ncbi:MAG: hypothetical protein HGA47_09540 [Zoogloea sp.]|nr:hypothetical protein [Zoogloea sp.]
METSGMDAMVASLHATAEAAGGRAAAAAENPVTAFGEVLKATLQQLGNQEVQADRMQEDYVLGADIPLHEVIGANELSDIGLKQLVKVRNMAVDIYQKVSDMPV